MVNIRQMVWEPIKYLIIFLIYVMRGKYLRTFRAITKCSHRSFKYPNEESGKIEKKTRLYNRMQNPIKYL